MTADAQRLVKAGQFAEARVMYAESQALIEMKDVAGRHQTSWMKKFTSG